MFAHLIKGWGGDIYFPTKLFLPLCAFFPFPVFVVVIFPLVIYLSCSSQQLYIFGFNQTCLRASYSSHGGFDLFHRTAWLGSPTMSSVCSSFLLFSTLSTASYYSSVVTVSYTLCFSSSFFQSLSSQDSTIKNCNFQSNLLFFNRNFLSVMLFHFIVVRYLVSLSWSLPLTYIYLRLDVSAKTKSVC